MKRFSVQQYQSRGVWECYLHSYRETLISHYKNEQKCLAEVFIFLFIIVRTDDAIKILGYTIFKVSLL